MHLADHGVARPTRDVVEEPVAQLDAGDGAADHHRVVAAPLVVLAGEERCSGSSRDWAAEGTTPSTVHVRPARVPGEVDVVLLIAIPGEADCSRHGGILQHVLRLLLTA